MLGQEKAAGLGSPTIYPHAGRRLVVVRKVNATITMPGSYWLRATAGGVQFPTTMVICALFRELMGEATDAGQYIRYEQ